MRYIIKAKMELDNLSFMSFSNEVMIFTPNTYSALSIFKPFSAYCALKKNISFSQLIGYNGD